MIWGATGGAIYDFGKNTVNVLTGDFEDINWDTSLGNISGGWDKLYGAGQHMNETDDMHQKYVLDEAIKQQQKNFKTMEYIQKNQGNIAFPVEKEIIIPGSAPVISLSTYGFPYGNKNLPSNYEVSEKNKEIQQLLDSKNKEINKAETYYAPRLPDKKITQETKQKVEKSVVKKENKKFEYVNNSKYEIKVTGETQNDVAKKVEGVVRRIQEEEKQRLRAELGGNYTQAGGLE